jgi:hypothetical protein
MKGISVFLNTETVPVATSGDGGVFKLSNMAPGTYTLSAIVLQQFAVAKVTVSASGTSRSRPLATRSTHSREHRRQQRHPPTHPLFER